MAYKLLISNRADEHIDAIIDYIANTLHNTTAAMSVINDIEHAYTVLEGSAESFALCEDPVLAQRGYHKYILPHHNYVILYRVKDKTVFLSGVFHMLENYAKKL